MKNSSYLTTALFVVAAALLYKSSVEAQKCPLCLSDGITFKHPFECEWYYECEDGEPVLKHCESGFHWNSKYQICDYPCLAGCNASNSNNTTPDPPTTSEAPTTPQVTTTSPAPTTPKVTTTTPAPTTPEASTTTKAPTTPQVSTTTPAPTPAPTTPSPPTPAPSTAPPRPSACPNGPLPSCPFPDPADALYFPHTLTCSWYYECSDGAPYCKPCPAGLEFNPKKHVCDYPDDAGCTAGP